MCLAQIAANRSQLHPYAAQTRQCLLLTISRMGVTAEPNLSSLLAQIHSLGGNASSANALDPTQKKQLRLAALKLHRALEEPGDIVERICFQVSCRCPVPGGGAGGVA